MIDNTIIVEIDMPNEIDVDLGDTKFITAPEKQVPQAVPQIDVDNNGLITATSVQEAGSVRAGTTKSIYQLAVEQGKTISPSGESQVAIEKGRFAVGDIVVSPLKVQEKELNVTDGGNYEVIPDNDYLLSKVDVNVDISAKVDEAFQSGAKSEYDRYWDAFQDYGKQVMYRNCFKSAGWNDITFKPKYAIKPSGSHDYMFSTAGMSRIDEGVLDLSDCNSIAGLFQLATNLIYVAPLDLKTITGDFNYMFQSCSKLETVTLNNIPDNGKAFQYAFQSCSSLINLTVTGTIGQNIDLHWSTKLTHESLMSIINALKNFSGTSETRTCTLGEANLAKLTDTEKAIATEKGWSLA